MKRGKNYQEQAKKFDKHALYNPDEALKLVKELSTAKFAYSYLHHKLKTSADLQRLNINDLIIIVYHNLGRRTGFIKALATGCLQF
jgi:hypothetical protein